MQYTDIGRTWQKLSLISGHARRERSFQFTSLAHLLDAEFLGDCYASLNRNKAVGVDEVSWKEYGENLTENLERLMQKLKRKRATSPSRRDESTYPRMRQRSVRLAYPHLKTRSWNEA